MVRPRGRLSGVQSPRKAECFTRAQRLRKRGELQEVQRRGKKLVSRRFVLLYSLRHEADALTRLGLTVSRRVGNAVQRNRAKRLLREAFRRTYTAWPSGIDVVLIARTWPTQTGLADVLDELTPLLPRLRRRVEEAKKAASEGETVVAKRE